MAKADKLKAEYDNKYGQKETLGIISVANDHEQEDAPEKVQEPEQEKPKKTRAKKQEPEPAKEEKPKRKAAAKKTPVKDVTPKMYGVRLPLDDLARWQAYTKATGGKSADLTVAAFNEYMKNHPLTSEQETTYKKAYEYYLI